MTLHALLILTVCDNVYVRDKLSGDCLIEGEPNYILHTMKTENYIVESLDGGENEHGPYLELEVL